MIDSEVESSKHASFSEFFRERYASAVRSAYLLTSSPPVAEDVAQDAFRQVWQRWDEISEPDLEP